MYKTKLIQLLKSLNSEELEQFEYYVNSPLYNKNKRCIQLLGLLKGVAPDYTSPSINKDRIFAKMFPNKAPTSSLRVATSLLTNLLSDFLVLQKFKNSGFTYNHMLLNVLQERQQTKLLERELLRSLELQEAEKIESEVYYYEYYKYQELNFLLPQLGIQLQKNKYATDSFTLLKDFKVYSLLIQLQHWASILNQTLSGQTIDYDVRLLEDLLQEIAKYEWQQKTIIQLWYITVLLLYTNDFKHFEVLKKALKTTDLSIPPMTLTFFYTILSNYCNRKIVAGELNYLLEMFHLYTQMIEKRLLYIGNYIPARHIKNIVSIGLRSKAFEQTLQFIKDYKTEVAPQIQESVYHFNLGALYFYQKDYNQALTHLIQVDKIDVYYDLDCQALLLKSYYELTDSNALLSFIGSYKNFVKNNKKIPKSRQKAYLNFINLTMNSFKIKALYGKKSPSTLKAKIQETSLISDKAWLLEKVEELIGGATHSS